MKIENIIREQNPVVYRNIRKMINKKQKKKEIKLGDSVENLMQHNSYRREGRRIRQVKWG